MELEAARFEEWNKQHQKSFRDLDDLHSSEDAEEAIVEVREAMLEGVKEIGEKVVAGLAENTKEGDSIDLPLRIDHTRDLVGRRHVSDPQGEPKSTLERLHERIPTGATESEKLVNKTAVTRPGPTKEEMDAAEEEQLPWTTEEEAETEEEVELPAAGQGAGVQGQGPGTAKPPSAGDLKSAQEAVNSIEAAMQPENYEQEPGKPAKPRPEAEKVRTTGAAAQGTAKEVPKTTAAAPVKDASKPADKEFKK
jgi:hypothetical protein